MTSVWKKTLFYLFIIFFSLNVLIPLSYLGTISLSSAVEINDYPKKIMPSFSHEISIKWDEDNEYYILLRKNNAGFYEELYMSSKYDRISAYLEKQLNVYKTEEEIEEDIKVVRETGEALEFIYYKSFFNNFQKFFTVFSGADKALYNSIKAAIITILISMSIGGAVGYALARTNIKGKDSISLGSLIVRMFPVVSISVPMAILLVR